MIRGINVSCQPVAVVTEKGKTTLTMPFPYFLKKSAPAEADALIVG